MLSQSTLYLSMGVVLQLLFYDSCSKAPCGHNLFRDRVSGALWLSSPDALLPAGQHAGHVLLRAESLLLGASIAPMLQEQLQLFLSMQNKVFSSFIEQISSCIVGVHSTPHS